MGLNLVPARTFCSCGCCTVIFERERQVVAALTEQHRYKNGELAYIELFVPGHEKTWNGQKACRWGGCNGTGPAGGRCGRCGTPVDFFTGTTS